MQTLLEQLFPNVMASPDKFWESVWATVVMTGWAGALMFVIGLCLGLLMVVLKPGGILACPVVYQILDKVVNLIRSIPFVILIALLMYVTKAIMGTRIGIRGVIVPLVVGSAPFFSRQVEAALSDIPAGLVEAAKAHGQRPSGHHFPGLSEGRRRGYRPGHNHYAYQPDRPYRHGRLRWGRRAGGLLHYLRLQL